MAQQESQASAAATTLYLDCQTGIAGDMLVAALLDLGGAEMRAALDAMLESLPVGGFEVRVSRVKKAGLDCCDFNVALDAEHDGRDHDMAYLHGSAVEAGEGHGEHSACEHGRHHEHRGLAEIEAIIDAAQMTEPARKLALRAFRILARAEARAHGVPVEQVHFHEVGAVDSIVDVLSAAVLIDALHVERTVVPVLVDGHGTVRCQHGVIPVPVPAVLNICLEAGLPLSRCEVAGELVTPTGAALVAALDPGFELPARYAVRAQGLGAGKRTYERPSILRAFLIEPLSPAAGIVPEPASLAPAVPQSSLSRETCAPQEVIKLECDIDDSTPEQLAYAAERLREAGAREVHWLPIFTKKGRPAYQLQVICTEAEAETLQRIIFCETTTIGVRRQRMERSCLPRSFATVKTPWGAVRVKCVALPDGTVRTQPEHEDAAALARQAGVPLQCVMGAARMAAERL